MILYCVNILWIWCNRFRYFYFETDHRGIHLPSITIVLMVHQPLRDTLGNNFQKIYIEVHVVSIIWTSMNVDVTSFK